MLRYLPGMRSDSARQEVPDELGGTCRCANHDPTVAARRPSTSIAESFSLSCVNASASRPSRSRTSSGARQALVTPACSVGGVGELSSRTVLHWLERDLGPYRGRGVAKPEWDAEFSVLQFDDRPVHDVTASVTFGIGSHVLTGSDGVDRRQELLVILRRAFDETAITLAAGIGSYLVDEHVALLEGETVRAPRELGVTMMLVGAPPDRFMPGIVRFGDAEPPLEVVWLVPFHESEHHVISQHGWRDLMRLLDERELDPFDLAREALL